MPASWVDSKVSKFSSEVKSASKLSSVPSRPPLAKSKSSLLSSGRSTPVPSPQPPVPPPNRSANEIYSQPANTGVGFQIRTQVVYAIEYLRNKRDTFVPLSDILSYLSKQNEDAYYQRQISYFLRNDEKVEYNADGQGSFRFRPLHNIRNSDQLLAYLQNQTTAAGLSVKDLRDGWPDIDNTINELAREDKLLVIRNKKDEKPRMIWPNDPSLRVKIDTEFVNIWRNIQLSDPAMVVEQLERAGLTPASKNRVVKPGKVVKKEKAKKKPRRGGKKTNTHMDGLLRDYSHLKK